MGLMQKLIERNVVPRLLLPETEHPTMLSTVSGDFNYDEMIVEHKALMNLFEIMNIRRALMPGDKLSRFYVQVTDISGDACYYVWDGDLGCPGRWVSSIN